MKILIIEDDPSVSEVLVQYLEQSGHVTACVDNGRDGLDFAIQEPVDLIILDRQLPENIDGLYLLKILRSDNNRTPVLILSGQATVYDHIEGFRAGTDDYLSKPFSLTELGKRIDAIVKPEQTVVAP